MAIIKKLKWGIFTSPQSGDRELEMNVIENLSDLKKFINENEVSIMEDLWKKYIKQKSIVLVYPNNVSWCTENTTGDPHPSCFNRVRLGELIK